MYTQMNIDNVSSESHCEKILNDHYFLTKKKTL